MVRRCDSSAQSPRAPATRSQGPHVARMWATCGQVPLPVRTSRRCLPTRRLPLSPQQDQPMRGLPLRSAASHIYPPPGSSWEVRQAPARGSRWKPLHIRAELRGNGIPKQRPKAATASNHQKAKSIASLHCFVNHQKAKSGGPLLYEKNKSAYTPPPRSKTVQAVLVAVLYGPLRPAPPPRVAAQSISVYC